MAENDILAAVAEATKLREGPEGVGQFLRAVFHNQPVTLGEAARLVRLPLPVATAVRRELEKRGLLARGAGISLSAEGLAFAEQALGLHRHARYDPTCTTCNGFGVETRSDLQPALDKIAEIVAGAPRPDVTLDQAPCTPATALRRVQLMMQNNGLAGRKVLFVGDDDLISLALPVVLRALGMLDTVAGIAAVDLDRRQLDYIGAVAQREGFAVDLVHHDLRQPLPAALQDAFDLFETDPPYTPAGARLFLSRGIEALRKGSGRRALFSFAEQAPDDALAIQDIFAELGLAATAIHPGFNEYRGAAVLGSRGRLYELVTTSETGAAQPQPHYDGGLYTADLSPRVANYQCTNCRARYQVGPREAFKVIADLQKAGCRRCHGSKFRRLANQPPGGRD